MFSSPAVQIYLSENAENHVQRKQGPHQLSRKPFIDRSVNGKSPADKKLKPKSTTNKDNLIKQKISPKPAFPQISLQSGLDGEDYMFSGKDIDETYNDVWPLRLGKEGIIKILRDYSFSKDTPPPSLGYDCNYLKSEPLIETDFLELLPKEICDLQEPVLLDESFEVDLPELQTFEDLDTSF